MTIFDNIHSLSHPSAKVSIKIRFTWKCLTKDIRTWARSCRACQRTKVHRRTDRNFQPPGCPLQPSARRPSRSPPNIRWLPVSTYLRWPFLPVVRSFIYLQCRAGINSSLSHRVRGPKIRQHWQRTSPPLADSSASFSVARACARKLFTLLRTEWWSVSTTSWISTRSSWSTDQLGRKRVFDAVGYPRDSEDRYLLFCRGKRIQESCASSWSNFSPPQRPPRLALWTFYRAQDVFTKPPPNSSPIYEEARIRRPLAADLFPHVYSFRSSPTTHAVPVRWPFRGSRQMWLQF